MKSNTKAKTNVTPIKSSAPQFKIEKGVALVSRKKPNPYQAIFSSMKLNDSFLIGTDEDTVKSVKYQATKFGRENNATFAFRITDEGHRCWKIK